MSHVNLCSEEMGAEIIGYSSMSDEQFHAGQVLMEAEDKLWKCGQGLPQYLIISLQKVEFEYSQIDQVGFYCWHDYQTNPKTIELQVAEEPEGDFIHWAELSLKLTRGKQYFQITQIPPCYPIIKIIVTETHGQDQTYLNQVFLMALPQHSDMIVNELDYGSLRKQENMHKEKQIYNKLSRVSNKRQIQMEDLKEDYQYDIYLQQIKNQQFEEQKQQQSSFSNNVAMLGLSQKMLQMEESIEIVRRNLQVLDLKVNISYEQLEKNIMKKIQKKIDQRFQRLEQQLKSQFISKKQTNKDIREVKSQKDKLEYNISREMIDDSDSSLRGQTLRENPKSIHIENLKRNSSSKGQGQKDKVVSSLVNKLTQKLKQREKIKKIEQAKKKRISKTKRDY